jgi:hypothetical protein
MIKYIQVGLCLLIIPLSLQFVYIYIQDIRNRVNGDILFLLMFWAGLASAGTWYIVFLLYPLPEPISDAWQTVNLLFIVGGLGLLWLKSYGPKWFRRLLGDAE